MDKLFLYNDIRINIFDYYLSNEDSPEILTIWDTTNSREILKFVLLKNKIDWLLICEDGRFDGTREAIKKLKLTNGMYVHENSMIIKKFFTPNLASNIIASRIIQK